MFFWRNIMTALRKVLVVDDDPVVGKSFHRVLSKDKGYIVITAQNAAEALERLREQEYDLVVTDIKMPGMNGVELAERVRANQPWTPVVIVTGYGSAVQEQRAMAAGVSAFVHKPLSPEMIERAAVHARQLPEASLPVPTTQVNEAPLPHEAQAAPESRARNIALFLAAPFIGLAYALMIPWVGLGMLLTQGIKALALRAEGPSVTPRLAMLAVAPFMGLAFVLLLPVVGLAMLAWSGSQALRNGVTLGGVAKGVGIACLPLLGLAYFLFFPIIGTVVLLRVSMHSVPKV
jgi:CheY-like chemotaxis protein